MACIYEIDNIADDIISKVGGKARGLSKLKSFGFNVPDAFIITDVADNDNLENVYEKYESMHLEAVSVRSSATHEDGNDFSAAGQFVTTLNVCGKRELLDAVRRSVDSLHNFVADRYSKAFLNSSENKMSVVVQKMVTARVSGVIFSEAPMNPDMVLVEAVAGLGENLVSGKVAAQQYLVRGYIIESAPSSDCLLSKEEIVSLAEMGKKAEELFGMPMDLEWAIDTDGNINWLQARPITSGDSVSPNEFDWKYDTRNCVYTIGNIGEVMPGAVTPLNLSTCMYALDWGIRESFIRMGCTDDKIPPFSYITPFYNHMFFNMSSIYLISRYAYGTSKEQTDVSICGMVLEGYPDIDPIKVSLLKKIKCTKSLMKMIFNGESAKRGINKAVSSLSFNLETGMKGIYKQILNNFDYLKLVNYYHYCTSYYSGGQTSFLSGIIEKDFKDKNQLQSLIAGILTQIEDFESANILRTMTSLARLILRDNLSVCSYSATQIMKYIDNEASKEVKAEYKEFMRRHGHRGILEVELRSPSWRSNRMSFFTSLKSILVSLNADNARPEKNWTDYADEILCKYKGVKRKIVSSFIAKARKGVCYREYTKSRLIYAIDQYKQAYRRLAELMTENGLLPDADCIYFLLQDEVGELLDGNRSLVKRAIARRRVFSQQQSFSFPYVSLGTPVPIVSKTSSSDTTLKGTPVSRGKATGRARIIRSEKDAANLEIGEIMVAACTDIGWTPYYSIVAAMVTEIGSSLSHGVVVAREYSLPTVVNVANAMNNIHNGDIITVDGDQGIVLISKRK